MTIEEERTRLAVRKVELVTAAKEARKHVHVHAMPAMLGLSPSPTLHGMHAPCTPCTHASTRTQAEKNANITFIRAGAAAFCEEVEQGAINTGQQMVSTPSPPHVFSKTVLQDRSTSPGEPHSAWGNDAVRAVGQGQTLLLRHMP